MVAVFSITILASATLIFWVEPLFARMVLPFLGGSPAVWNTCLVFFQGALLVGYLYAHLMTRWLPERRQIVLHLLVLASVLFVLPVAVPSTSVPPGGSNPIPWLLGTLTVGLGAPFVALSATAPLLQRWLSLTRHPVAADPYFLYASSNTGSLVALLAYPFIIEPNLGLLRQSRIWTMGYWLLFALIAICSALTWRQLRSLRATEPAEGGSRPTASADHLPVSVRDRSRWLGLAFVPSSLLLGVTTYLTTDVAAVPLFWVVPLALYMLSFVVVFSRHRIPTRTAGLVHAVVVPTMFIIGFWALEVSLSWQFTLHLGVFFATAVLLHGALADARPDTSHLTGFYLWMSIGGVLGGMFSALLAPILFDSLVEYGWLIVAACLLRPGRMMGKEGTPLWQRGLPIVPVLLLVGGDRLAPQSGIRLAEPLILALSVAAVGSFVLMRDSALRFTGAMVAIVLATTTGRSGTDEVVLLEGRNFYGSYSVTSDPAGRYHILYHGTTVHGAQAREPHLRATPITYYHPNGPAGDVFTALDSTLANGAVAAIGLGTGSLACYREPGQRWTFYEIDPDIGRIARDNRYFTYLEECAPDAEVVFGDGRLAIGDAPGGHFQLIVLDAFSSDAIPVHLLTREALSLYLDKLAPGGVLLFHISNRYVDLQPVLAALAAAEDLVGLVHEYYGPEEEPSADEGSEPIGVAETEETALFDYKSDWVILSRNWAAVKSLATDPAWTRLRSEVGVHAWTDDFSNLVRLLDWHADAS